MTTLLALETATGSASLALLRADGKLLAETTFAARRTMASRLLPTLDALCASVDLAPTEIDALAVGLGPGSFTSLRVGLATAQGIALACAEEPPLLGVGTLEVLAAGAPLTTRRPVCAVLAAPKRSVYAAAYARLDEHSSNCLFGPELLEITELAHRLRAIGHETLVVGPLAAEDRALLAAAGCGFAPPIFDTPRAAVLGDLALARLAAGERHALAGLTPLYVHPSEPEVRLGQVFARAGGPSHVDAD